MLSSKRKKIYIGVIIACTAISITCIIWYTRLIQPPPPIVISTNQNPNAQAAAESTTATGGGVKVFPNDTGFNLTIFDSNKYKTLRPGQSIKLDDGQLGRDNPFIPY